MDFVVAEAQIPVFVFVFVVLLNGALLGAAAKALLGDRSSLSFAAAALAGIFGAGVSSFLVHVLDGRPAQPDWVLLIIASLVGTIVVLLIAERFTRKPPPTTKELIAAGETSTVEFKSTARHNLRTDSRDERIELVLARTVAGLLNHEGGTVLVGVDDHGRVLGLESDMQYMKASDVDRYELWLHDFLTRTLGSNAVTHLSATFPEVDGSIICRIDIAESPRPVFVRPVKSDKVIFYARLGNSTRQLSVDEAIDYAADHFPSGVRR